MDRCHSPHVMPGTQLPNFCPCVSHPQFLCPVILSLHLLCCVPFSVFFLHFVPSRWPLRCGSVCRGAHRAEGVQRHTMYPSVPANRLSSAQRKSLPLKGGESTYNRGRSADPRLLQWKEVKKHLKPESFLTTLSKFNVKNAHPVNPDPKPETRNPTPFILNPKR